MRNECALFPLLVLLLLLRGWLFVRLLLFVLVLPRLDTCKKRSGRHWDATVLLVTLFVPATPTATPTATAPMAASRPCGSCG